MHRVYDFADEVSSLRAQDREHFEIAAAEHRESGRLVTGIITAVTPDSFTLSSEDGTTTTWPVQGSVAHYRRGTRCTVVTNEDAVIGLGPLRELTYVTLPELVEVWVESRGAQTG